MFVTAPVAIRHHQNTDYRPILPHPPKQNKSEEEEKEGSNQEESEEMIDTKCIKVERDNDETIATIDASISYRVELNSSFNNSI